MGDRNLTEGDAHGPVGRGCDGRADQVTDLTSSLVGRLRRAPASGSDGVSRADVRPELTLE